MRRIAIEDFADGADAVRRQVMRHGLEERECARGIAIDAQMRQHERSQQPRPHGSLMIGGVALGGRAAVMAAIARIGRVERSQAMRRDQAPRAKIHHGRALLGAQRAFRQRHRENLIGPQGRVVAVRPVDHVEAGVRLLVPKSREAVLHAFGQPT